MEIEPPSGASASLAILGAHSAVGQALRRHSPDSVRRAITRHATEGEFAVEDYERASPEWFEGCSTVLQCVGISQGSAKEMQRLNIDLPLGAAKAAIDSGVSSFIHISSFSVYGLAERISSDTPAAPRSDYGRSKAECDEQLLALSNQDFRVQLLRLPAIVGPGRSGKMASLVKLCRILGRVVRPVRDIERSVISPDLAANAITALGGQSGVFHAADPTPFSYALLEEAMAQAARTKSPPLLVPKIVEQAMRVASPGSYWSLFRDCLLEPGANLLARDREKSDIAQSLIGLARTR